ncbi:unnamed protein product [Peronospora belbahrii]|uniref:Uncharacterized protein n=1 Tax=Peronospora belbahrii TaxID=622444 RepID=A0AAU9LKW1_9STRA|nr:unnamed protein product [Peronospora belbahrii]
MERKRTFGGPPIAITATPQPFTHRRGSVNRHVASPRSIATNQSVFPPPSSSPHVPQSVGLSTPVNTNTGVTTRKWRPERVGGRHNSPLYGKHRKRPSSSSIDSNVSWSGSEIESSGGCTTVHNEQEQVTRLSWASSVVAREEAASTDQQDVASAASLFGTPVGTKLHAAAERKVTGMADVQPRKISLCNSTLDCDDGINASSHVSSRTNSTDNLFAATSSPVYDEEKNGPQSCPSLFNNTRQPQFSIDKLRQLRSNELIASKLLPTRSSVDSLMGYVRELQLSEATLRKQLMKNKQHTEEELTHSLSKVNELERTVQEVERDRELARRKLEEQEQLIRDLAAKLKQAEAAKSKISAVSTINELPAIAEEASSQTEIGISTMIAEKNDLDVSISTPAMQQQQFPISPVQENNSAAGFGLASPRSPNRPLWDPWVSGGANLAKSLPPVFTIGSTGLDPVVSSSTPSDQMSTDLNPTSVGDYELKSVLSSPRQEKVQIEAFGNGNSVQHMEQNDVTVAPGTQQEFIQQSPAAMFNMGAMPSPTYSHEQTYASTGKLNAARTMRSEDVAPLMQYPSQAVSMLPVAMTSLSPANPLEHEDIRVVGTDGNMINAIHTRSNEYQDLQEGRRSTTSALSFVSAEGTSIKEKAPPALSIPAEYTSVLPPSQVSVKNAQPQYEESEVPTGFIDGTQVASCVQESCVAEDVVARTVNVVPPGSSSHLPLPTSDIQTFRPASAQIESAADPVEHVSLETLLVDFFTEADNKRLKMAKVYGKRYAGREKWLFAELTKRYGAAKVTALKARFENGSGGNASTVNNRGSGTSDHHATHSSDASTHPKAGRQVHSRHPQFLQPPIPASNADSMSAMSFPAVPHQEKEESCSQTQQVAEEGDRSSTRGARMSADSASSPQKRQSGGHMLSLSSSPPLFSNLQETGKEDSATAVGTGDSTFTSKPALMTRHGEPPGQFNQLPPRPQTGMDNSNAASLGLRQRHQSSGHSQTHTDAARPDAKRPAVTLEGLLKELYKKHQPDKLKNVSIVAKQYAGRERELVGLLKGKYGALSVKRLEENLDVLERANRASMGHKGVGKKRGCFIRTISLLFWLSLLLYFSFGAVFVSFVVLDAWGCHAFDSEEQELEAADDCLPLKKELDTFTYERIPAYMSQSHPDACFCSEWKARESAVFGTFSCASFVNLVRLVPFTPESFGVPWVATVKEQVPSQEVYDSYTKPVLDLSLDISLFMWTSVLDLAGYNEALEKSTIVKNAVAHSDGKAASLAAEDSAGDAHQGLVEQTADVGNGRFPDDVNDAILVTEEVEDEAVGAGLGVLEQARVEEDVDTFAEKLKADYSAPTGPSMNDPPTDITDNVLAEDEDVVSDSEDMKLAKEEGSSFFIETEVVEHATIELINNVELEDAVPVEASELTDSSEQDLSNAVEVEETWTEDDSVSTLTGDVELVRDADDGLSAFTETEEVNVAAEKISLNDVEEVSDEAAVEVNDEVLYEEVLSEDASFVDAVAESGGIVEVEVRQEGVDLSYPETETYEALKTLSAEVPILFVDQKSEPLLGDGQALSAFSAEMEMEAARGEDELDDVFVGALEGNIASVMSDVDEDLASLTSTFADADVEVMNVESDDGTARKVFETEAEAENVEEEQTSAEVLEVEPSAELSSDFEYVAEESELPNPIDVNERELMSVGEEIAGSSLNEGGELETDTEELDHLPAPEFEAQETETTFDEEVGFLSVENDVNMVTDEEFVLPKSVVELSFNSRGVVADAIVSEEGTACSSDGGYGVTEEEGINDHDETVSHAEMEEPMSNNVDDENVLEEKFEEAGDGVVIPDEIKIASKLELEEYAVGVPNEDTVVPEWTEDLSNQDFDLQEGVEEAAGTLTDIEAAGEESGLPSEAEVEKEEEAANEMDEVASVESPPFNEIERRHSVSEVDLADELDERSVAIEAAVGLDDEDTESAEHAQEVNGHVVDTKDDDLSLVEGSSPVTDESEPLEEVSIAGDEGNVGIVDEETYMSDEAEAAVLEVAPATDQFNAIDDHEDLSQVDGLTAVGDVTTELQIAVDDMATELQVAVDESSAPVIEEEANNGFVSAMNEVLARLVEPFEAAKIASPILNMESEYKVDDEL